MLKCSGKTQEEVIMALAARTKKWMENELWKEYYAKIPLKPRPTLLRALEYFKDHPPSSKTAIDLGCGKGNDTLTLLKEGWSVYAIDKSAKAIELLEEQIAPSMRDKLK